MPVPTMRLGAAAGNPYWHQPADLLGLIAHLVHFKHGARQKLGRELFHRVAQRFGCSRKPAIRERMRFEAFAFSGENFGGCCEIEVFHD